MRIIAGKARGLRLKQPKQKTVRPTADRVKEGLFNVLQQEIVGSIFLDGYAGSGSIGLEAISRGASQVYFVEKSPSTVKVINENLELLRFPHTSKVICQDLHKAVGTSLKNLFFDIIYLDPPYTYSIEEAWPLAIMDILVPNGLIIFEQASQNSNLEIPLGLKLYQQKIYGSAQLLFLVKEEAR